MSVVDSGVRAFNTHSIFFAFLKVETDVNSERLQVLNRFTGEMIWHQRTDGGETVKRILPANFIGQSNLLCVLLDDDLVYQPAVFDGATPETIDVNNFDMASA